MTHSFVASLATAIDCAGYVVDPVRLMGTSGFAFRIWAENRLLPNAMNGLIGKPYCLKPFIVRDLIAPITIDWSRRHPSKKSVVLLPMRASFNPLIWAFQRSCGIPQILPCGV